MKDGDITQEVQECDNGYVIARLDAYTDTEATESNRESIISERQQTKFSEVYDGWTEELEADWNYEEDVNQELWAELILHEEESTAEEGTTATAPAADTTAASTEAGAADTTAASTEAGAADTTAASTEAGAADTTAASTEAGAADTTAASTEAATDAAAQ